MDTTHVNASEVFKENANCKNIDKWVGSLIKRIADLETKCELQAKEILELKNAKETPKTNGDFTKDWVTVVSGKKKPQQQLVVMNAYSIEQQQKKKKAKNVIIFGAKESEKTGTDKINDDLKQVEKIFEVIEKADIKPVYIKRMKSKKDSGKPGPILVELAEESYRNPILAAAKKLKNSKDFKDIYISPDLTDAERFLNLEWRKERNRLNDELDDDSPFYYGIRSSGVVKIKKQKP